MLIPEPSKNTAERKTGLSAVAFLLQQNYQNTSTEKLKGAVPTARVVGHLQIVSFPVTSLELGFSCWRKLGVFSCTFYLLPYDSRLHINAGLRRERRCWCTSFLVLLPSSWFTCFCIFMPLFQILDEVEKRRGISPALVQPLMRSVMEAPFPALGRTITVKNFLPGSGTEVKTPP